MANKRNDEEPILEPTEEDAMEAELRHLGYSRNDIEDMQELVEQPVLKTLEQLTRGELVQRAVDLDIQDAEALPTTDLIAEIRSASPPYSMDDETLAEPIE